MAVAVMAAVLLPLASASAVPAAGHAQPAGCRLLSAFHPADAGVPAALGHPGQTTAAAVEGTEQTRSTEMQEGTSATEAGRVGWDVATEAGHAVGVKVTVKALGGAAYMAYGVFAASETVRECDVG